MPMDSDSHTPLHILLRRSDSDIAPYIIIIYIIRHTFLILIMLLHATL